MKLVEILARELKEWPCTEKCIAAHQSFFDKEVYWRVEGKKASECVMRCFFSEKAEDFIDAWVTRAQWEAERARIAKDESDFAAHIGKIQDGAFASALDELKESLLDVKYEQELWDKVASEIFIRACDESIARFKSDEIEYVAGRSALYADAFMAERAKRMKG